MAHTAHDWMWNRLRRGALALAMLPALLCAQPVQEPELKAAFVYNFILFTEWPAGTVFERDTLNICANPNGPLQHPLQRLTEKSIHGRKIALRPLVPANTLWSCHVLYLDASDREYWKKVRNEASTAPLLTISDHEEIGFGGSIIVLAMNQNRIVFDIDTRAAGKAGLSLSSKLLRLARTVL